MFSKKNEKHGLWLAFIKVFWKENSLNWIILVANVSNCVQDLLNLEKKFVDIFFIPGSFASGSDSNAELLSRLFLRRDLI